MWRGFVGAAAQYTDENNNNIIRRYRHLIILSGFPFTWFENAINKNIEHVKVRSTAVAPLLDVWPCQGIINLYFTIMLYITYDYTHSE